MEDHEPPWCWPVTWEPVVRRAVAEGRHPDTILDQPELLPHRVLDQISARARAVRHGVPGSRAELASVIHALAGGAPWLLEAGQVAGTTKPAAEEPTPGALTRERQPLISEDGVMALLAVAGEIAGREGVRLVQGLTAVASVAEQLLPIPGATGTTAERADMIALIAGEAIRFAGPARPDETRLAGGSPGWDRIATLVPTMGVAAPPIHCVRLLAELSENLPPAPTPDGEVTWTTGIQRVDTVGGCGSTTQLVIHGTGFGSGSADVAIVASVWDTQIKMVVHRQMSVVDWSTTQIRVTTGAQLVSGSVAFLDLRFLRTYEQWAKQQNQLARQRLRAAGCPAVDIVDRTYSYHVTSMPAALYQAGAPIVVAEVHRDASGSRAAGWDHASVHIEGGRPFWLVWRTANADTALLRGVDAVSSQILASAGHPTSGIATLNGSLSLIAPARATLLEFQVQATNRLCGTVTHPLQIVVTGAPLRPLTITVLQSLPGGDVEVVDASGVETLRPSGGESIPLVAEKRTVVRIDWWPAVPQVPVGTKPLRAHATLKVTNHGAWPSMSGTLRPGESTAEEPPTGSIELSSGPPFDSLQAYQQWLAAGNQAMTFNVVLPAEWCKWEATLEASVSAFAPGPSWTVSSAVRVRFHRRRRVRIRYRRHTVPSWTTPTTRQAEDALRVAGSLLPIPDPEIVVLGNDPAAVSTSYIEDMIRERNAIPGHKWEDEIWLVVGPAGVGGVADQTKWQWTAATDARGTVTAHEIGHMFGQAHLALCGAGQNPDDPATFPNQGNVVVTGWDTWNNAPVQNGIDLMSYCWGQAWMSPERWRRIFLKVGKP